MATKEFEHATDAEGKYIERMLFVIKQTNIRMDNLSKKYARGDQRYFNDMVQELSEYEKAVDRVKASLTTAELSQAEEAGRKAYARFWEEIAPSAMDDYKRAHPGQEGTAQEFLLQRLFANDKFTQEEKAHVGIMFRDRYLRGLKYIYEGRPDTQQ